MSLLRAATTVGGLTMVSRVLGFVRDMLIAAFLGTGAVADAFVVAFRFPNLFRRLFGEGAFNAAFVPLFSRTLTQDGKAKAKLFASEALSVLVLTLAVLVALAELAMPWLIHVIAPGFSDDADKLNLTRILTQIAFPYLLFMSVVALLSGVLNALGRFAAAAAAPILLNIVLISVLGLIALQGLGGTAEAGHWLAWGVSVAGLAQLVMLILACRARGFLPALARPRLSPGIKRLAALGLPGVIAGGITQINILIGTIIASFQDSAVSYLYYADRIYQLPLGVVGVAVGIALLPDLSARLAARDFTGAEESQNRACEFSMMLILPATVALIVMPLPILKVLFERGAFTASDSEATALALAGFALGLPAFVLIKIFSPGFFAREDTRNPMLFAAAGVAVNISASLVLFYYIGHVGIALATSLAGWVNAGLLWAVLARRGGFTADARLRARLPRILLASAVMGAALWFALSHIGHLFDTELGLPVEAVALAGMVIAGAGVYFIAAIILGAISLREIRDYFTKP